MSAKDLFRLLIARDLDQSRFTTFSTSVMSGTASSSLPYMQVNVGYPHASEYEALRSDMQRIAGDFTRATQALNGRVEKKR